MIEKLKDYLTKTNIIYPPLLYKEWSISPKNFSILMTKVWKQLPNPVLYENRIITNFNNNINNYEICDTRYCRGKTIKIKDLQSYCLSNQKSDQHISVYGHDDKWVYSYNKTKTVSCTNTEISAKHIYLELDRESLEKAIEDSIKIYEKFPFKEAITFWYSGNRSIHIQIDSSIFGNIYGRQNKIGGVGKLCYNLAHKIIGDVRHNNGIDDIHLLPPNQIKKVYYDTFGVLPKFDLQQIKQQLENTDPNVYRVNSLIRQPWSYHEKTNKQKILLDIEDLKNYDLRPKNKNKLAFLQKKSYLPYMLHWAVECSKPKIKETPKKTYNNTTFIIEEFNKHIEGFDESLANEKGYVNGLYSPFYKDTNPSVGVNIKTGYYADFGDSTNGFMDFYDFYSKIYKLSREEAIKQIISKENVDNN